MVETAGALASHIICIEALSNCNDADQADALMKALRFVGRSLVSNHDIHFSQSTAQCLAHVGPDSITDLNGLLKNLPMLLAKHWKVTCL